jgi:hypothetical protein
MTIPIDESRVDRDLFSEFLEISDNDLVFIASILNAYKSQGQSDLQLLQTETSNERVKEIGHGWKGRALQLGFKATAEAASRLNQAGQTGEKLRECFGWDSKFIIDFLADQG